MYDPKNEIVTTLSSSFVHGTDTSAVLTSATGFPATGGYIRISEGDEDDDEWALYEYTGISTNTLTGLTPCTLGNVESTASHTFVATSTVELIPAAEYLQDLQDTTLKIASNLSDVDTAATAFTNIKQAASKTATGVVEIATAAETKTGTDALKVAALDSLAAVYTQKEIVVKGAEYWFPGINNEIIIANDASLNFNIGDFSIVWSGGITPLGSGLIIGKKETTTIEDAGYMLYMRGSDPYLRLRLSDGVDQCDTLSFDTNLADDRHHTIVIVVDRDTDVRIYVDGILADIETTGLSDVGDIDNARALFLGRADNNALPLQSDMSRVLLLNLAPTAAESLAFSSGAPVPYKYLGASQTEFFTTAIDRTFTGGATHWANVDFGTTFDETTDLSLVASATGQYCKITFTDIGTALEIGKRYRLTYDYAETTAGFEFKLVGGATQTLGDAVAGTGKTIEFTADEDYATTEYLGIYSKTAAAAAGNFDNFSLVQIGCVLQLEQPGIGHNQWLDVSGNELHGEVSSALPINVGANHTERYVKKTVTGETTITIPTGYAITNIAYHNITANAVGNLNFGFGDDDQTINADVNIGANAEGSLLLLKRVAVIAPGTTDNVYISSDSWNSGSIDFYITLERLV